MSNEGSESALVDQWLEPLAGDEPCGKDLEYDNAFLALQQAAQGKPESQFDAGEPPDWRTVRDAAQELFDSTRDLRIAVLWVRAQLNLEGLATLPAGLRLIHGLLDRFWDTLHPLPDPDDNDPYARANALAVLPASDGMLGDLRQALVCSVRGGGDLRLRMVEIALGHMQARPEEPTLTRDQITQMLASAIEQRPELRTLPEAVTAGLKELQALFGERFDTSSAPDLKPLRSLVFELQGLVPAPPAEPDAQEDADAGDGAAPGGGEGGGAGTRAILAVRSREEAVRAIDLVCEYLSRAEPTNPAQMLLKRARRLIDHDFLQLIKELAPDSLNEVARLMGVDPDSVSLENQNGS